MSDLLFTCLWTFSTAFVLMQVKTGLYTHIQLCFTLFFKSGMISTTYHKYSKFFIENIPSSSVLCFENLLKEFFNLDSEVFVDCSFFFFFSVMKNCVLVFERN